MCLCYCNDQASLRKILVSDLQLGEKKKEVSQWVSQTFPGEAGDRLADIIKFSHITLSCQSSNCPPIRERSGVPTNSLQYFVCFQSAYK